MSTMSETREYEHEDGRTQGVYVDSELDKLLASDPDWSLVKPRPSRSKKGDDDQ